MSQESPQPTIGEGTRIVLTQPCDDTDTNQRFSVTVVDNGGGYVAIRTRRWAIDSERDIDALVDAIRRGLALAAEVPTWEATK